MLLTPHFHIADADPGLGVGVDSASKQREEDLNKAEKVARLENMRMPLSASKNVHTPAPKESSTTREAVELREMKSMFADVLDRAREQKRQHADTLRAYEAERKQSKAEMEQLRVLIQQCA